VKAREALKNFKKIIKKKEKRKKERNLDLYWLKVT